MDRFKHFLTPVDNVTPESTRALLDGPEGATTLLLDVRQSNEYAAGHIPGAKLVPLPELPERLGELEPETRTIIYCASGVRSRSAAQFLNGRGFTRVSNMLGGMHAWEGQAACGTPDVGLHLLPPDLALDRALLVAYGMEAGLALYYERAARHARQPGARALFSELAHLEQEHRESVADAYRRVTGRAVSHDELEARVSTEHLEGGMTIDEYLAVFDVDLDREDHVLALAMQVETQALDLYLRAAARTEDALTRQALRNAALEEQRHLERLGTIADRRT